MLGMVLKDEHSPLTNRVLRLLQKHQDIFAPVHWWIEVANGLHMAERRSRITRAEVAEAFAFIRAFPITIDGETAGKCEGDTLSLARQFNLTVYDAAYLELAIRLKGTLATNAKALAKAGRSVGLRLLPS